MDGSLVVLSGPQGVACVELPSNLTSLEAKANQQGPSEKIAKYNIITKFNHNNAQSNVNILFP